MHVVVINKAKMCRNTKILSTIFKVVNLKH